MGKKGSYIARCSALLTFLIGLAALVGGPILFVAGSDALGDLVYSKNTLYQRVFVSQRGTVVSLQFGRRGPDLVQSQVNLANLHRHMHEYTVMAFAGLLYNPRPERVLVLGLGGGVIPREMSHYFPETEIDVVEIDPDIPNIAERYFGFRTNERLKVHVMDGRVFVGKQLRQEPVPKYDVVILDAFNSDYIPFHLMTREFLEETRRLLTPDGVVVANVFYTNRLFDAELATYRDVFGPCDVYKGAHSGNAILVAPASDAVPPLSREEAVMRARELQRIHNFSFNMRDGVAVKLHPNWKPRSGARVLTDDRAPVNRLRNQPR